MNRQIKNYIAQCEENLKELQNLQEQYSKQENQQIENFQKETDTKKQEEIYTKFNEVNKNNFICWQAVNILTNAKNELKKILLQTTENTDRPLELLKLTARTYNTLRRKQIDTIEELEKLTKEELLRISNIGQKSIKEIEAKLGHEIKEKQNDNR